MPKSITAKRETTIAGRYIAGKASIEEQAEKIRIRYPSTFTSKHKPDIYES
jgi:hypothetical protein